MKKNNLSKQISNLKKTFSKSFKKIQRRVSKFAPVALVSLTSWLPVNTVSSTSGNNTFNSKVKAAKEVSVDDNQDVRFVNVENSRLAMAELGSSNAYKESLAQVSINTEAGDFKNPAAAATGNGYYGQHQMNMVSARKYVAYTLVFGSQEMQQAVSNSLLRGTAGQKQKLIEDFSKSVDAYDSKEQLAQAFMSGNKAYEALSRMINVSVSGFKAAHSRQPEEARSLQENFIYQIYLRLMPMNVKEIVNKHPKINLVEVHPAVMSAFIAIAVKQGNGHRFNNALTRAEQEAYRQMYKEMQKKENSIAEKKMPLVVINSKGPLKADNIAVIDKKVTVEGKQKIKKSLVIYDETGAIDADDIYTETGRTVSVIKSEAPKNLNNGKYAVVASNKSAEKLQIGKVVNNPEWLEEYCGSFLKVYNEAQHNLHKVPTLDTYYEMSVILDDPKLYSIFLEFQEQSPESQESLAFEDAHKSYQKFQKRVAADYKKLEELHGLPTKNLAAVDKVKKVTNAHRKTNMDSANAEIVRRITQNRYTRS